MDRRAGGCILIIGGIAFFLLAPVSIWGVGLADPCTATMFPGLRCVRLPVCGSLGCIFIGVGDLWSDKALLMSCRYLGVLFR
ncbi:MAG: hypothetical protein ABSB29_04825 [Nitrososphaerales archaeon]